MTESILVAHRGLSMHYPENSMLAIEQAVIAGARAVEFDVQCSVDLQPLLLHDINLQRLAGVDINVTKTRYEQLHSINIGLPEKFGQQYKDIRIAHLAEAAEFFLRHKDVIPVIEIKQESLRTLGHAEVLDSILKYIAPIIEQSIIISFDIKAIEYLHAKGIKNTGWILQQYNSESLAIAEMLQPALLVCNIEKLADPETVWSSAWQWMLYKTEDVEVIRTLVAHGVSYIETDDIKTVLQNLSFDQKRPD